jgi:DNA-binding response OmpR family regulator
LQKRLLPMSVAAGARAPISARRRILVVDDDPHSRDAVASILSEEGYDAQVAADGEEASGLICSWCPDLVVTDLDMPRLDGRGLLRRVRQLRPGTPVIVLSAHEEAGIGSEIEGFFSKPIEVDGLLARIRDLVGH